MPTGYTADVVDGKITEFPDFAMTCARAFGALIDMRDEPFDAPIPEEFEPHTSYHDQAITKEMKRLGEIQAMTNAEADAAAKAEHEEAMRSRYEYLARKEVEGARLNAMLAKVRAWEPPTPDHHEMKNFMIQQLTVSMPGQYEPGIPVLLDGATWRKQTGDKLAESIVYHKAERQKEIERTTSRTEWLKSLRASLAA
jgi:arginine/lysine/ornithine decarboxylase